MFYQEIRIPFPEDGGGRRTMEIPLDTCALFSSSNLFDIDANPCLLGPSNSSHDL
jgi:hypothetical protein